jgi:hypothetical protein
MIISASGACLVSRSDIEAEAATPVAIYLSSRSERMPHPSGFRRVPGFLKRTRAVRDELPHAPFAHREGMRHKTIARAAPTKCGDVGSIVLWDSRSALSVTKPEENSPNASEQNGTPEKPAGFRQ